MSLLSHASAWSAVYLILTVSAPVVSGQEPSRPGEALPREVASYEIEVSLDTEARTLRASQSIAWRNTQDRPTDEIWLHLYWNAWKNNRSTWMEEDTFWMRERRLSAEDWGYCLVDAIRLVGEAGAAEVDLTSAARYRSPDDGNPEDRTVLVVGLPAPVAPGEVIRLVLSWHAKIPRNFTRTGFTGQTYMFAHWFPKLGVFEEEGWNCHQFHAASEFFSDFGTYDVVMRVPAEFVVGATGRSIEHTSHPDGTVSYRYRQEDVHDFAWTASPHYLVLEDRFEEEGLPPVDMRLLLQPEHRERAEQFFAGTRATLKYYGLWYGPYPYDHITIVDQAYGSGMGGMEYPTLFTTRTNFWDPEGGGSPERLTVHECGHQFWYGLVANNEFEHAWLDEGLNTFSTARAVAEAYGESRLVKRYLRLPSMRPNQGFIPVLFEDLRFSRMAHGNGLDAYRRLAAAEIPATPTYQYYASHFPIIAYNKPALWLSTLERFLGWETLQRILSTYFERWKFRHPRPEDFFAIANEVSGQNLDWFFRQVHEQAVRFDYAVRSVSSQPAAVEGLVDEGAQPVYTSPEQPVSLYRHEVVVGRNGGGTFPVDVVMVFGDGTEIRRQWDGKSLWKRFVEEGTSKLAYAVVDPERKLLLDLYYTNNSQRLESKASFPAVKWSSKWMIWLQDLLAVFSFYV